MVDGVSISAIIISSLTALGGVIAGIHIKRMKSGCCESECFETHEQRNQRRKTLSAPPTPIDKMAPITTELGAQRSMSMV